MTCAPPRKASGVGDEQERADAEADRTHARILTEASRQFFPVSRDPGHHGRQGRRLVLILGHEPDARQRRQRQLGRERLAVPRHGLGLDAAEVAHVRAAVGSSRC